MSRSLIKRRNLHTGGAIDEPQGDLPRIAADFAILDILLVSPASGVHRDSYRLTAIWAYHISRVVSRSIAKRKIFIEVKIVFCHSK